MNISDEHGYLAIPQEGQGPGILLLHAWWGLNEFFKSLCERLAGHGFVTYAPDLYEGKTATTVEEAERLRSRVNRKQVSQSLAAAVQVLQTNPAVAGDRLGVIGFSMGAYYALGLSVEIPAAFCAAVIFYGTRGGDYSASQCSYLGHFAETDEWVSTSGKMALERSLRQANRPAVFHTYPGTGHWFFEAGRPSVYHPAAAELAWARTLEFLLAELAHPGSQSAAV
jgi:carboxymethylenebutenolidase